MSRDPNVTARITHWPNGQMRVHEHMDSQGKLHGMDTLPKQMGAAMRGAILGATIGGTIGFALPGLLVVVPIARWLRKDSK